MESQFPQGVERVSVWRMACQLAGQNPIEISPNAETLNNLQQICTVVLKHGGIEWASVSPDRPPIFRLPPGDAMSVIALMATRPEEVNDWEEARRQLILIDLRRDDWKRYEQHEGGDMVKQVSFRTDDIDSPVIDCEKFISKLVAEKHLDGPDLALEENELVRLGAAEEMRQAISFAVKAGRLNLRNQGGHVVHSGLPRRDDHGPWTGVFFEREEFLSFADTEWLIRSGAQPAMAVPDESRTVTMDNPHKPDWNVWRHALKATLREAVSLSCDTDPKVVALGPVENFFAQVVPMLAASKDVCEEISRRRNIARSHAGAGGTLPTVTGGNDGDVYLAAFAGWALNTMKWVVPDELRALAGNGVAPQSLAANPAAVGDIPKLAEIGITRHSTIATRSNILDPVIDSAIKKANSMEINVVFPAMREMALSEESPFKGVASDGALEYTDTNGKVKTLSRDALQKRLKRRQSPQNAANGQ